MKTTFIIIFIANAILFAQNNKEEHISTSKHIKAQIEKEKKYSLEQKFYQSKNYDFKGAEVDDKLLDKIPDVQNRNDDFDMDSVYD